MMRDQNIASFSPVFQIGDSIVANTVAKVIRSENPKYNEGALVVAHTPVAEYARLSSHSRPTARQIRNPSELDLGHFLGMLGMPGLTAFSSLYRIGKPKRGETIFVSSAAGAVGQVVGQIAKREGLEVIGSVG